MDRSDDIEVVRIKPWEQYGWLRHGFSTRPGGVSGVYGGNSLNLGWTKEDDASAVIENRRRFVEAIGGKPDDKPGLVLVGVRQIHSAIVHPLSTTDGAREGKLATAEGKAVLEGDGLITALPGVLIGVGTADCVPVLVVDTSKRVVAAFHAGWRGSAARIVENGIEKMRQIYGSRPEDLVAAIGPSIGPCCYAVGDEVQSEFASKFDDAKHLFNEVDQPEPWRAGETLNSSQESSMGRRFYLDLWEANRRQLLNAGLKETQMNILKECTACSLDARGKPKYFSHRGEHGIAGRMLNVVGITR
jgi:hypothetical protein